LIGKQKPQIDCHSRLFKVSSTYYKIKYIDIQNIVCSSIPSTWEELFKKPLDCARGDTKVIYLHLKN